MVVKAVRATGGLALAGLLSACGGITRPDNRRPEIAPAPEASPPPGQRQRLRQNHEMWELAEQIPGFGGLFLSYPNIPPGGRPHGGSPIAIHVYLTSAGDSAHARWVVTRRFQAARRPVAEVHIVPARYTFEQLDQWLNRIVPAVSNLGLTLFSASGGRNQVWIAFDSEAGVARARDVIKGLGIPLEAVRIDVAWVVSPR